MKRLIPLFLLLCTFMSFCKKNNAVAPVPVAVAKNLYQPYSDTFSGKFTSSAGTTSSLQAQILVTHDSGGILKITGNTSTSSDNPTDAFNDVERLNVTFKKDSSQDYNFYPDDNTYQEIIFRKDSIYICTIVRVGCLDWHDEYFAGIKMGK